MNNYEAFLERKSHANANSGFPPLFMPEFLFDFQQHLVDWAIRKGRAAIFADCGLGKTPMQLVWAENVIRQTNKSVLILTPLAVSAQTIREAEKFGIEAVRVRDGCIPGDAKIIITNYERLESFDPNQFAGLVCDESSILKSFDGVRRGQITEFMKRLPYRLLCTATAAPNDYTELGTSSEALGYLGHMDMLNRFFKNDNNTSDTKRGYRGAGREWRFKGHAEEPFWRWVCSWGRAVRKPSDLGFSDGPFRLPELIEREHFVETVKPADGMLFALPAVGLVEQRGERRRTIEDRCEAVGAIVAEHKRSLVWCHLNDEGDLLERMIPGAIQVSGNNSDEQKEEALLAFADGVIDRLITKQKIAGWGLNFQSCNHIATFPSHSYEQYYQGVRRCWRFGQTHPVTVDIVGSEGEAVVMANLRAKAKAADEMFSRLTEHMANEYNINRTNEYTNQEEVPSWL